MKETEFSERLTSLEEAKRRYGRGLGRGLTFAATFARCYDTEEYWWYVATARRFSGNTQRKGFRAFVAGPYRTKREAEVRAREFRNHKCCSHTDCIEHYYLGVACFKKSIGEEEYSDSEN